MNFNKIRINILINLAEDTDEVINLQFSPATTHIDATWQLNNPSGDVTRYRVAYEEGDFGSFCFTDETSTYNTACDQNPLLVPCQRYNITVQPQNIDADIGVPVTGSSYTLPGKLIRKQLNTEITPASFFNTIIN